MALSENDKHLRVQRVLKSADFIQFQNAILYRTNSETHPQVAKTNGFERLTETAFARLVYRLYPGISNANVKDIYKEVCALADDWSRLSRYVAFRDRVWDTEKLAFAPDQMDFVFSSKIAPQPAGSEGYAAARRFLLELASGDEDLAGDYAQAAAPLFMGRKPSGIIWFVGDGANGKSSLITAIYRLIGKHLTSLTVSAIEDGRATPSLNGTLGNVVRESSEARVEDTERYKAIGTHEPFEVRRFHSQEMIHISGNFHTIFNANNIPVFADKTQGARRRTLVIPFPAHFKDDPTFEDRTFTKEFLGGLLSLVLEAASLIAANGYRYQFSDATMLAKEAYDSEVNSAEAYLEHLRELKVVGFSNFTRLRVNYENWCGQNGLVPLMTTGLTRVFKNGAGATGQVVKVEDKSARRYFFIGIQPSEVTWLDNGFAMKTPNAEVLQASNERLSDEW